MAAETLLTSFTADEPASYVLQLIGHGKGPALSLEPDGLDLGAVKACEALRREVVILNSSQLTVRYEVSARFVGRCLADLSKSNQIYIFYML